MENVEQYRSFPRDLDRIGVTPMITRRTLLKAGTGTLSLAALGALQAAEHSEDASTQPGGAKPRPLPSPAQVRWQEAEIGLLYDFIFPTVLGDHNLRKVHDPKLYNPKSLDTEQWLDWVPDSGARYAVFTAHHFSGFMQWQSDAYPYGLKQAAWKNGKGDVAADFAESCRKRNIGCGFYYSVHINAYHQAWKYYVNWGKGKGTPEQAAYNRICERQMEDLTGKYGPLIQIWMDSGSITPSEGGADLVPIFEKNQPDSNFYSGTYRADIRWVGNESGHAGNPNYSTMPILPGGRVGHKQWMKTPEHRKLLHSGEPRHRRRARGALLAARPGRGGAGQPEPALRVVQPRRRPLRDEGPPVLPPRRPRRLPPGGLHGGGLRRRDHLGRQPPGGQGADALPRPV